MLASPLCITLRPVAKMLLASAVLVGVLLVLVPGSAGDRGNPGLHGVRGRSFVIAPVSGTVSYALPPRRSDGLFGRGQKLVVLRRKVVVPVRTSVYATRGRVALTSVRDAIGGEQTAEFYGGSFVVTQEPDEALTTLTLIGGDFRCGPAARPGGGGGRRRLWGNGRGNFRTRGRWSSAVVRGTIWLTDDSCSETITRVRRGRVDVTPFEAESPRGNGVGGGGGVRPGGSAGPPVRVGPGSSYTASSD